MQLYNGRPTAHTGGERAHTCLPRVRHWRVRDCAPHATVDGHRAPRHSPSTAAQSQKARTTAPSFGSRRAPNRSEGVHGRVYSSTAQGRVLDRLQRAHDPPRARESGLLDLLEDGADAPADTRAQGREARMGEGKRAAQRKRVGGDCLLRRKALLPRRSGWIQGLMTGLEAASPRVHSAAERWWVDHGLGAFSSRGKAALAILDGKQRSADYIYTVSEHMLPFAHRMYGTNFTYQQDNTAIHCSRETMDFFSEMQIMLLAWPARSPDLNPIENVWAMLARSIYQGGKQYRSVGELRDAILVAWDTVPMEALLHLLEPMPRRCIEVIEKKGSRTHY